MELTGKCKKDFKKWYLETFIYLKHNIGKNLPSPNRFHRTVESMQYGVYVDFFDSVGIRISIRNIGNSYWYVINHPNTLGLKDRHESKFTERPKARDEAVEKANEIYNLNNN